MSYVDSEAPKDQAMNQASFEEFELSLVPGSIKGAMRETGASSRDLWQVPIGDLRVIPNFNVRINGPAKEAHVRWLANSMKKEGYYQHEPIAGYVMKEGDRNVIAITDGHCRFEAAQLAIKEGAAIERLPTVVAPPGTSLEDLTVGLVRLHGKPLEPYEVAVVCKRLVRFGWDMETICDRLDLTAKYVEGLLLLIGAHPDIRAMVTRGEVSASTAIDVLRRHGPKALAVLQRSLASARASGGDKLTRRHLPEAIFKKHVSKAAPVLFNTMREVKSDPGYEHISPELRIKLETMLAELDALEQPAHKEAA